MIDNSGLYEWVDLPNDKFNSLTRPELESHSYESFLAGKSPEYIDRLTRQSFKYLMMRARWHVALYLAQHASSDAINDTLLPVLLKFNELNLFYMTPWIGNPTRYDFFEPILSKLTSDTLNQLANERVLLEKILIYTKPELLTAVLNKLSENALNEFFTQTNVFRMIYLGNNYPYEPTQKNEFFRLDILRECIERCTPKTIASLLKNETALLDLNSLLTPTHSSYYPAVGEYVYPLVSKALQADKVTITRLVSENKELQQAFIEGQCKPYQSEHSGSGATWLEYFRGPRSTEPTSESTRLLNGAARNYGTCT